MASCEKCWDDAGMIAYGEGGSKVEIYHRLLKERKERPCSPKEQAGQWWNEDKQCDSRLKEVAKCNRNR